MTLSIVTPWRDAPELIPDYEAATAGARLVIVDHCSEPANADLLRGLCARSGGAYVRDDGPWNFSRLNNIGLALADADAVLFMNNDISAAGPWLAQAERDCSRAGVLCGPSLMLSHVAGRSILYLEGWAIGAHRSTWAALGGWCEDYAGGYWEDNDLALRAIMAGYVLRRRPWPLRHKSNYTTSATPGAYAHSEENRARFEASVVEASQHA